MAPNQNTVTVTANDLEPANDPVEANVLTVLPVPIAGVSAVTNPGPASRATADETDAALHQSRVARKRPEVEQVFAVAVAECIAERIAQQSAGGRGDPDRREIQQPEADQRANAEQDHDARQQDTDQHQ